MINGLDLLVHQALLQIELMTEPSGAGRGALRRILAAAEILATALTDQLAETASRPGCRERLLVMLRWLTAGESHGPALVAILEGLPAHVEVTTRRHRRRRSRGAGSASAAGPG